jgi:hypothetical protein
MPDRDGLRSQAAQRSSAASWTSTTRRYDDGTSVASRLLRQAEKSGLAHGAQGRAVAPDDDRLGGYRKVVKGYRRSTGFLAPAWRMAGQVAPVGRCGRIGASDPGVRGARRGQRDPELELSHLRTPAALATVGAMRVAIADRGGSNAALRLCREADVEPMHDPAGSLYICR